MNDEEVRFFKTDRTVAYIRVSDESQVEEHSLEAQQREIERWCQNHKYAMPKIYVDAGVVPIRMI
jgi:DNA invertase Pin-like site-specific DNA recombinase